MARKLGARFVDVKAIKKLHLFKVGTWTDSAGNTRTWTREHLRAIAEKYNAQQVHDAPQVLGHPAGNGPAYGWTERLYAEGDDLFGDVLLDERLYDSIAAGHYRKRSVSLYPDLTLRHVGWLGDTPPAVKGLSDEALPALPREYKADDITAITYEFEDPNPLQTNNPKQKMEETLNKILEALAGLTDLVKKLSESQPAAKPEDKPADGAGATDAGGDTPQFSEAQRAAIDAAKAETAALRQRVQEMEFKEFLDSPEMRTRVSPAMRSGVLDTMRALSAVGEFNFSDGKADALGKYKASLKALPEIVSFKEVGTDGPSAPTGTDYAKVADNILATIKGA